MTEIMSKEETVALRNKHVAPCVELFFKKDPLKIVRASGQYMYDEKGNEYLDCLNNVAHVGHCHPHVVETVSKQMGLLETNSRFLHDNLPLYSKRLAVYLPPALDTFFYTNSGSEANDLALRITQRVTGGEDVIILDHAYHGHLTTIVDISPYKFNHPSGTGQKEWVHMAPVPDSYRGKYRSDEYSEEQLRDLYAQEVIDLVERAEKKGRKIGIFLAESLQSCGGQIVYPRGYLSKVYKYLQGKGILCLADEVQCGFYRTGTHMWGFQTHGDDVVPDFLTIGKSMGNGHPVACLVTKRHLAEQFGRDGLKYFNTYGGNPVSMQAANAVLDVIENEKLYLHVSEVSSYLLNELERLKSKHQIIGDIRGYGYFIGIDMVKDRNTREPASEASEIILHKMKDNLILLNLDGPYSNVLKFKPPLSFDKKNAEHLIAKLDQVLTDLEKSGQL